MRLTISTINLDTQLITTFKRLAKQTFYTHSNHKQPIITMQLTALTAMLFAAIAVAGPIALPAKDAAANVEVFIVTQRSTASPSQTTDENTESRP